MKNEQEEGLRILSAEITNFKNISHKEVEIGGKSMIIAGENGAGKSSFIQALASSIDSNYIPLEPIKVGEDRAEVEIEIGGILNDEMVKYKIVSSFDQGNKKGTITLFDQDGSKISGGKKIIESIVGNVGFDIFEFIKKGKTDTGRVSEAGVREQIEILSSLMPQEGKDHLNALDLEKKDLHDERYSINLEIKNLKEVTKMSYTPDEIDLYIKEKDEAKVKEKIAKLSEEVETWNDRSRKYEDVLADLEKLPKLIDKIKSALKEAEEKQAEALSILPKYVKFFEKNPEKPSMENLSKELDEIREHNEKSKEIAKVLIKKDELALKEQKSEKITERMEEIKGDKKSVFASYPLPVKNLEFDEDNITYKGLPLNSEQLPSSVLIRIGVMIGMAMNPNLRLMIIRDGSLLDTKTMQYMLTACSKKGYQLLIEKVQDGVEDVQLTFIEKEVEA